MAAGHGGSRANSGRKAKTDDQDAYTLLAKAKAKREVHNANITELDYKRRVGELLERSDVETAAAKMHATIAQALRTLPDELERKCGIAPEAAELVERFVDGITLQIKEILDGVSKGD